MVWFERLGSLEGTDARVGTTGVRVLSANIATVASKMKTAQMSGPILAEPTHGTDSEFAK